MQNELSILFESLLNRGIQREFVDPNNINGFLNETYAQAFTLVKMICDNSKKITEDEVNRNEIYNVIAFTGRRGTGKTSAMLSIADSLIKIDMTSEKKEKLGISDSFIQLPYINAAVIDEKEDILLIVLSKMFKELDDRIKIKDYPYEKDLYESQEKSKKLYVIFMIIMLVLKITKILLHHIILWRSFLPDIVYVKNLQS